MRRKDSACAIWDRIRKECPDHEEVFAGSVTKVCENTIGLIKECDNLPDQFSLAIISKDVDAIKELYSTNDLGEDINLKIKKLLKRNNELLLTLNPFVLQDKYSFLSPYLDDLVLDTIIQDRLLSLDDYELKILEKIVNLATSYGINSNNFVSNIIDKIGCSSLGPRNDEVLMQRCTELFNMLKIYEKDNPLDDNIIENIGYILKTDIFPCDVEELMDYDGAVKDMLIQMVNDNQSSIKKMKDDLCKVLFGMKLWEAEPFAKNFNLDGIESSAVIEEQGIAELFALKMIMETEDIEKLREVANMLLTDEKFKINLFNANLMEENLLLFYAKEINKCHPTFSENNLLEEINGIKVFDAGNDFYAIVKTLGAFSNDGLGETNYFEEWNNDRYRSHVNAVSLIRNDNLAFAEQDGKMHVKLGFLEFEPKMFMGGGNRDVNSTPDSRRMGAKIYSKLWLPSKFIDNTREWHNELDYERRDANEEGTFFKKNPDYIILDQECEDISCLTPEEQKEFYEYRENTFKAAREFGNLPVLVINREKIANNEMTIIHNLIESYKFTEDYKFLESAIIRFNNNRNGCRGTRHKYIRENYFSNECYQNILNEIDGIIKEDHKNMISSLIENEYQKMDRCLYDKTTSDMPITPALTEKRGGLNV